MSPNFSKFDALITQICEFELKTDNFSNDHAYMINGFKCNIEEISQHFKSLGTPYFEEMGQKIAATNDDLTELRILLREFKTNLKESFDELHTMCRNEDDEAINPALKDTMAMTNYHSHWYSKVADDLYIKLGRLQDDLDDSPVIPVIPVFRTLMEAIEKCVLIHLSQLQTDLAKELF